MTYKPNAKHIHRGYPNKSSEFSDSNDKQTLQIVQNSANSNQAFRVSHASGSTAINTEHAMSRHMSQNKENEVGKRRESLGDHQPKMQSLCREGENHCRTQANLNIGSIDRQPTYQENPTNQKQTRLPPTQLEKKSFQDLQDVVSPTNEENPITTSLQNYLSRMNSKSKLVHDPGHIYN